MVTKDFKRLARPRQGRKIAGVCAAFGNYFNIDPTIVRVFWLFLLLPGGIPGLLLYLLCWLIIPEE